MPRKELKQKEEKQRREGNKTDASRLLVEEMENILESESCNFS
jgi:hypothetical protein